MRKSRMFLAFMSLATILAVAACGGGTLSGGDDGDESRDGGSPPELTTNSGPVADRDDKAQTTSNGAAPGAATGESAGGGDGGGIAGQLERKIIFNANLDVAADDVHVAFADASRVARTAGGYIEKSRVYARKDSSGEERTYATLTVRVPVGAYQDVLASLRTLPGVKVTKEESSSREVTEQYTDLQSRLRNLERSEAQYLKLLEQAKTIQEIMTVNDRIDSIRLQIERIQGQMNVLDDLADLATIDIAFSPPLPAGTEAKDDGPKSPGEAFEDAWEASIEAAQYVLSGVAAAAAVAVWLVIPVLLLAFGGVRLARRRKPRATEPAN
ncbi:MAG: DUF4349 domain-containing protein [Chloroflexi bacterium CFX7]|nr:DUF4349 domain-containing protein [Chloroflexi bacterium CFX7]